MPSGWWSVTDLSGTWPPSACSCTGWCPCPTPGRGCTPSRWSASPPPPPPAGRRWTCCSPPGGPPGQTTARQRQSRETAGWCRALCPPPPPPQWQRQIQVCWPPDLQPDLYHWWDSRGQECWDRSLCSDLCPTQARTQRRELWWWWWGSSPPCSTAWTSCRSRACCPVPPVPVGAAEVVPGTVGCRERKYYSSPPQIIKTGVKTFLCNFWRVSGGCYNGLAITSRMYWVPLIRFIIQQACVWWPADLVNWWSN